MLRRNAAKDGERPNTKRAPHRLLKRAK